MRIKTYKPEKQFKLSQGDTVPVLVDVGSTFATLGGMLSFFVTSFGMSLRSFFKTKKRVREMIVKHERIVDLR